MSDLASELLHWAPPSILALASTGLATFVLKQFGRRWEKLEAAVETLDKLKKLDELIESFAELKLNVDALKAEMQGRVSVSDHRESVRQLWDEQKKMAERIVQLETEARVRRDLEPRKRARS